MNEVLHTILSSKAVVKDDGITRSLDDTNIPEEEGDFLQEIIRVARPRVSLEVGCAYGVSSLYICEALREVNATKHIIIDPWQNLPYGQGPGTGWEGIGLSNIRRAGYEDLVEFSGAPSYQYLSRLAEEDVKIDFAFIDGQHTFDYVLVDVFLVDKILKPGGIIIIDDFGYPSIASVCRYVLLNLPYKCIGPGSRRIALRSAIRTIRRAGLFALGRTIQLNLPITKNYIALQKLQEDLISETLDATRHWTDHVRF
jgi:hypothetical protein